MGSDESGTYARDAAVEGRPGMPPDAAHVCERVSDTALRLLSGLSHPPRALKVSAGEVTIELEWPVHPPGEAPAIPVTRPVSVVDHVLDDGPARRYVSAPTVGVLYLAPQPGAKPFVEQGDLVMPGQQVAIVEAMKLMIPVRAEESGTIVEIVKKNGEPVEYGEPLFAYTPMAL